MHYIYYTQSDSLTHSLPHKPCQLLRYTTQDHTTGYTPPHHTWHRSQKRQEPHHTTPPEWPGDHQARTNKHAIRKGKVSTQATLSLLTTPRVVRMSCSTLSPATSKSNQSSLPPPVASGSGVRPVSSSLLLARGSLSSLGEVLVRRDPVGRWVVGLL